MDKINVGIIGCTGIVGQRFITLLTDHPWFQINVLAASEKSAGKRYRDAVFWRLDQPMPDSVGDMSVLHAGRDADRIANLADILFCAVNLPKAELRKLEEDYARREAIVVSNNSAHRFTPDVPMIIPEVNPEHLACLEYQRKRLGTRRGCIITKSNCSIQSYVPALHPLRQEFGLEKVLVCTYQALSGAGKTPKTWPEMRDNIIPYISGEEEKSEKEPLKIWGGMKSGTISPAGSPVISAQCLRVPVSDGHTAAVFADFVKKPSEDDILSLWKTYRGLPQELSLPSAPKQLLQYYSEDDHPQPRLDRLRENGMQIGLGRLRQDSIFHYKFVCLSHNTLRGAAGGAVLLGELLCAEGYLD